MVPVGEENTMSGLCFFCERKKLLMEPGWFAPSPDMIDVRINVCRECIEKAQTDWKNFFNHLDLEKLEKKYDRIFMDEIIKNVSKTHRVIRTDNGLIILPKGTKTDERENDLGLSVEQHKK